MKNQIISLGLLAISSLTILANEVTLYTYRHYEADAKLYEKFTADTGIKVNIVKSKADALMERLKSEGTDCKADLLVTSDAARLVKAKNLNLLQSAKSNKLEANVPSNLRDVDNQWFGITVRARVIAYNKDKVKAGEIQTYDDLAKPEWKGRILARSSSNIYNQSLLASMIANKGKREALLWALKTRQNMARKPQGSDRDQMRAVAAGVADAAIVNTYYVGLLANSDDPKDREVASKMGICFPNSETTGTHINISGAGICKHAPNKDNAIQLLEFLTSAEAQATFPKATSEFPLTMKSDSPLLLSWGEFKADTLDLSKLGEHNAEAAQLFNAAKWE